MKNNIFKQTDIDSNASFKATTVYCETTYIISGHFEDGKVVITDERPFPNITQEQINDLPQYYLFIDSIIRTPFSSSLLHEIISFESSSTRYFEERFRQSSSS